MPSTRGAAAVGALGAEHQPRGFGAPRSEQAREANHLAAAKREIERRNIAGLAIVFEARADLPHLPHLCRRALAGGLGEFAAEHHADQFDPRQFGGGPLADQPAVAQNRDAVADLIDLIEKMRDEDDADAAQRELAHHRKEDLDLMAIEARGRLVEDQHPRRLVDGARDRGDVLNRDRIVSERLGNVDMQIELRKQRGGAAAHLGLAHQTEPRRLPAEIEVLRHRQVLQQIDLLIDGRNARIDRRLGRARRDLGAAEADDAGVAREHAGHRLDQGGFPCAVLAEQRVNFAGPQGEIHLLQGAQRAKAFAQATHLQQR